MVSAVEYFQVEKYRTTLWLKFLSKSISGIQTKNKEPWYHLILENYREILSAHTPPTVKAWTDLTYGKSHSQVALEITSPDNIALSERDKLISLMIVLGTVPRSNKKGSMLDTPFLGFPKNREIQVIPVYDDNTQTIIGVKCLNLVTGEYIYDPFNGIPLHKQNLIDILRGIYFNFNRGLGIKDMFLMTKKVGDRMRISSDKVGTIIDVQPSGWFGSYDTYLVEVVTEKRIGLLTVEIITEIYEVKDDPHAVRIVRRVSKEVEEKKSW